MQATEIQRGKLPMKRTQCFGTFQKTNLVIISIKASAVTLKMDFPFNKRETT